MPQDKDVPDKDEKEEGKRCPGDLHRYDDHTPRDKVEKGEGERLLKFRDLISTGEKPLLKFRDLIPAREEAQDKPSGEKEHTSLRDISFTSHPDKNREDEKPVSPELPGAEDEMEMRNIDLESVGETSSAVEEDIEHLYAEGVAVVEKLMHAPNGEVGDVINEGELLLRKLVRFIEQDQLLYDRLLNVERDVENYIPNHCVSVAILSLEIAHRLDYNSSKLLDLGLCALFHDVGMAWVPADILSKRGQLGDREFEEVKKHPIYGHELMERSVSENPILHTVTLQEHEREDGSGYPYGLKGKDIHEYAKIVGLADVFEALSSDRIYRQGFTQFHTIREILHWGKNLFHPRLLRALLHRFSLFPVNSYVRLNNKAVGKVISTNSDYPMRPVVQLLYDEKGRKVIDKQIVELHKEPLLYVLDALREEEALSSGK